MTPGSQRPALDGVTVVDLTRVLAGPFCTMILGDLGARVIKVEMPETGDDARQIGPFIDGESMYFYSVNRGKESIALDLKDAGDREIFFAVLERADVLVENFTPGTMTRLGLGWEELSSRFPRLVMASVSGFGQTGPASNLPAYDMVVQAMGGVMSLTGSALGEITRVGVSIGDLAAGLYAVIGIEAALIQRQSTSRGSRVDIAMLDCQIALLENAVARFQATGESPGPIGARHPSAAPFAMFHARDKPIVIAAANNKTFAALCRCIGAPELVAASNFATIDARSQNHAELTDAIQAQLCRKPRDEWLSLLRENGVPCGPVNDTADIFRDEQVKAREMLLNVPTRSGRSFLVAGNPVKLGEPGQRGGTEVRRAPKLDQDRFEILRDFGLLVSNQCPHD